MRLVLMGGALRKDSLNRRLLHHIARVLESKGHEIRRFEGEALRFALYDADIQPPHEALDLQKAMLESRGMVIVSPEYNAGIPAHLKNAVDWTSTFDPNPWRGLPVLLASASPGAFGGSRGMLSWRAALANMGAIASPDAINVPLADKNLDQDGTPLDARTKGLIPKILDGFLGLAERLSIHP